MQFQNPKSEPLMFFSTGRTIKNSLIPTTFLFLLCVLVHGANASSTVDMDEPIRVGAIVDANSFVGRQRKLAMEIAVKDFNANSRGSVKISVLFSNYSGGPLQAALAAKELIEQKQVKAIIGMETWQEAALVADVGSKSQVPIISLSAPVITPPHAPLQRPYLIQMAHEGSDQIRCLADIVHSFQWRRIIVIYEDEPLGGDSGAFSLLTEALQKIGSEVEYQLVFPPLASVSDPGKFVHGMLRMVFEEKLYSRVFVVLRSSSTSAGYLFQEANDMGLMEKDSVWIVTENIVDLLPSLSSSIIQGALGITTCFPKSESLKDFEAQFSSNVTDEYPRENKVQPRFHYLLAYDGITAIGKAVERLTSNTCTSKYLLKCILSSNFIGLSGRIKFAKKKLDQHRAYRILNVGEKGYPGLHLWTPSSGFSFSCGMHYGNGSATEAVAPDTMDDHVIWPGNLSGVLPKGWMMPSVSKPMKIGVPDNQAIKKFVTVPPGKNPNKNEYSGFCIDLFRKALEVLDYNVTYEFIPLNGTYDGLVDQIYYKTFDAVIGDVTILANRSDYVEFTQPFEESGLSMIRQVPPDDSLKGWVFMKPFKTELWITTFSLLLYTMFIIWFLEHRTNPAFRGSKKSQISMSLWFTFSSLFFSHREKIYSSYTRVVLVVWLFVVLVITQSYVADLSSMLTMERLSEDATDMETLARENTRVGYHKGSFVEAFLVDVLRFNSTNIIGIERQFEDLKDKFSNGNITAAFLEVPYARLLHNQYCDGYTISEPDYRFGGLGFAFPKGSPIGADISRATLQLTEDGTLKTLEQKWLNTPKCPTDADADTDNQNKTESLSLKRFWGLFVISAASSSVCFLASLIQSLMKYRSYRKEFQDTTSTGRGNVMSFADYILDGERRGPSEGPADVPEVDDWTSSSYVCVSLSDTSPAHSHIHEPSFIEVELN